MSFYKREHQTSSETETGTETGTEAATATIKRLNKNLFYILFMCNKDDWFYAMIYYFIFYLFKYKINKNSFSNLIQKEYSFFSIYEI